DDAARILDYGELADAHEMIVDFKNTVLIMTSNIGSDRIYQDLSSSAGADYEEIRDARSWGTYPHASDRSF
ncbi:MAG: AAA family ATPase, partial [Methanosarcinales archaeon]|nr:AAA family ATPase [Methanosarcinales archaeon]